MKGYGLVIKKIRTGKGYTQKYVSKDHFSQGGFSKFENNITDISMGNMEFILNQLDVTFEEFFYIIPFVNIS